MNKKQVIMVTGAAGFIGSHLCEHLINEGHKVIGLDNFITGKKDNLNKIIKNENFELKEVDLNDQVKMAEVWQEINSQQQLDLILYFASPASPPLYQKYPIETYLVNTLAWHNLLTWVKTDSPQTKLLFASTSEVYGDPQVHPQVESYWGNVNPNGVRSCYDESKRLGETIAGVFERDFDLDIRIVRIFNTYGPRMDLKDGRVLPEFIQQGLRNDKLTVYGDGKQTRSYCYIDDLVKGILLLAQGENLKGKTVNLGNEQEWTILQTAELFNEMLGRDKAMIEFRPLPKDDPTRRRPDISLARKLLDWESKVDFKDGLQKMWASYQEK